MTATDRSTRYIVVTDLDGTLLDHYDYRWHAAQPALDLLRAHDIPVVINTSKTANEVHTLQKKIGLDAAFIVENGSAIFIPHLEKSTPLPELDLCGNHWVKLLGQRKTGIVNKLHTLRAQYKWKFEGFSDWNVEQIVAATGLTPDAAKEASQREFSEPLIWQDSETNLSAFQQAISELGLAMLRGGRFIHILGNTDKGKATRWLRDFYSRYSQANYKVLALGDGPNDIDMLMASDLAVMIKSPAHAFPSIHRKDALIFTEAYGPQGWNEAIHRLKSELTIFTHQT